MGSRRACRGCAAAVAGRGACCSLQENRACIGCFTPRIAMDLSMLGPLAGTRAPWEESRMAQAAAVVAAAVAGGQPTFKPDIRTSELPSSDAAALRRASRLAGAVCKQEQLAATCSGPSRPCGPFSCMLSAPIKAAHLGLRNQRPHSDGPALPPQRGGLLRQRDCACDDQECTAIGIAQGLGRRSFMATRWRHARRGSAYRSTLSLPLAARDPFSDIQELSN